MLPRTAWNPVTFPRLEVQLLGALGILLDEGEAELGLAAHQALDPLFGELALGIRNGDPQQGALGGIHGGLAKLRRRHLAETLEPADLDLGAAFERGLEQLLLVGVVARIERLGPLGDAIERRLREIEPAGLD